MHPLRLGQNRSKPKVLLPPPNPLHHINPYTTTHADGNSDEDTMKDYKKNTNKGSDDNSNDDDSDNGDSSLSDTDKAKTAKTTTPPRRKSSRKTIQGAPVETNGKLPDCKIALCTFCCCIEIALCTFNPPPPPSSLHLQLSLVLKTTRLRRWQRSPNRLRSPRKRKKKVRSVRHQSP